MLSTRSSSTHQLLGVYCLANHGANLILLAYPFAFSELQIDRKSQPVSANSICVVVGWIMGRPLDLNFQLFETTTLIMTVLVVAFMLQDGTSNFFKGVILVFCYLIVAASSLYI
uniref:Sodium/calcium exchanger membrane region domain-containing protein n=1 Tax=Lactuca sativa TaxID=4236 RepID=A0A9R1VC66_LACSA|nr:hypothetical protein LSAT_V11C500277280 [Lactuca sativa]